MRIILVPLLLCLLVAGAASQDNIRTHGGQRYRGEILWETEKQVGIVTLMGTVEKIARADIKSLRKGRPLNRKVRARLESIDETSPDALVGVARWADQEKLSRDAKIVARRALAIATDHAEAREFLGHAAFRGTWYPDRKAAEKAARKALTAEGYVKQGEFWIGKELRDAVKESPGDWVGVGLLWRHRSDLGERKWRDVWYPSGEADIVPLLERLHDRTKAKVHGARRGASVVLAEMSRKDAADFADVLEKGRTWFIDAFGLPDDDGVRKQPYTVYVMATPGSFERFFDTHAEDLGLDRANRAGSLKAGTAMFPGGNSVRLENPTWNRTALKRLSDTCFRGAAPAGGYPFWLVQVVGHHLEILQYKNALVEYTHLEGENSQWLDLSRAAGSVEGHRAVVRRLMKDDATIHLRTLLEVSLSPPVNIDLYSVVVLDFLIRERKAGLRRLVQERELNGVEGFEKAFGKIQELQYELHEWAGLPVR